MERIIIYTIYEMKSNLTEMIYIGVTKNYEDRKKQHLRSMKGRYHKNRIVQETYDNGEQFIFTVLNHAKNEEEASTKEKYYIKQLREDNKNKCCNLANGGLRDNSGYKQSDYAKEVASKVHSQKNGSKNSFYGKTHTDETKKIIGDKISKLKKGVKFSEEHKLNLAKANSRAKKISIKGKIFHSLTSAQEATGISRKLLSRIANNGTR